MNRILTSDKPSVPGKTTATDKPKKIGTMYVPPRSDKPSIPKQGPDKNC